MKLTNNTPTINIVKTYTPFQRSPTSTLDFPTAPLTRRFNGLTGLKTAEIYQLIMKISANTCGDVPIATGSSCVINTVTTTLV